MNQIRSFLRWLGALLTAWGTPSLSFGTDPNGAAVQQLLQPSPFDPDALRAVFAPKPCDDSAVVSAVCAAFTGEGLPIERFGPTFDLAQTGKIYDVLYHALRYSGALRHVRTVGDVVEIVKGTKR